MSDKENRVLSCIQPTGEMHLGNYFGAVSNWVKLQDQYECVYGVVDLHAMTMPYNPEHLRANTERLFIELMACGLDPEKSILFVQSLVPEHAELTWIFSCVCPFGDLSRMTQFKDKSAQVEESGGEGQFISAGLFTYPVLQAADILVYRADKVPIGKDQEQHLELSREIVRKFNFQFNTDYFAEPKPLFTPSLKILSPADPSKKMSKSLGEKHYIGVFEAEDSVRAKIKTAVTDTGVLPPGMDMSPGVANLFELLTACGKTDQVNQFKDDHKAKTLKYVHLKGAVADALVELTSSLRAKRDALISDRGHVWDIIYDGSRKAQEIASQTISEVREIVGLPLIK